LVRAAMERRVQAFSQGLCLWENMHFPEYSWATRVEASTGLRCTAARASQWLRCSVPPWPGSPKRWEDLDPGVPSISSGRPRQRHGCFCSAFPRIFPWQCFCTAVDVWNQLISVRVPVLGSFEDTELQTAIGSNRWI
jgi:hypothetical protein